MRIAIAGATGLIGHAAAARLAAGGHSLVRIGRGEGNEIRCDLRQPDDLPADALAGCEALIHAAGVTDEDFGDAQSAYAKAIFGSMALAAAARRAGVARIVYVSSAHVYGPLEGRIDEACPPNPISDYAIAHFAAEQVIRRWALETGGAALLLRPCAVFGMPPSVERFARWSLIPFDFPRQALGGRIVLKTPGTQRRNFVAAGGLAGLIGGWLGQAGRGVQVHNAAGDQEMTVYDFALRCVAIAREEGGRECVVERPAPAVDPVPFLYAARDGSRVSHGSLDEHARELMRVLIQDGKAKP